MHKNIENFSSKNAQQISISIPPPDESFSDRRRFDRLLLSLSARCMDSFSNELDREIEKGLKDVAEYFQVDRIILWEFSPDGREAYLTHFHSEVNVPPALKTLVYSDLPYIMEHIKKREVIPISCIDDLPASADIDRQTIQRHEVKSLLAVPLFVSGAPLGALSLSLKKSEHPWSHEEIIQAERIGEIIANSLDRKRVGEELRRTKERYRTLFSRASDGIFIMSVEGELVEINESFAKMHGYSTEEMMYVSLKDLDTPESFRMFQERKRRLLSGEVLTFEVEHYHKDGHVFPLEVSASMVPYSGGSYIQCFHRDITGRKRADSELRKAYDEITKLKERLEAENIYLRQEMNMAREFDNFIGQSDVMKYVFFRIQQVASTNSTVLITGETGTGKGMVARSIHHASSRSRRQMVMVNCAALPGNLIESELFGREKGAFTGAHTAQIGRFELADKGTIFLDEIGELPLELQAKLLRVIEDGEFERLGSPHSIKVDVRIIASTNRDLSKEIHEGRFREDLYYRLNVFPITVPPMRQRKEDIPLLVRYFVDKHCKRMGKQITLVPQEVIYALQKYLWPGNVRELENIIERSVIGSPGHILRLADLITEPRSAYQNNPEENIAFPLAAPKGVTTTRSLLYTERTHILKTLDETGWRIEGMNGAAEMLGIKPSTLRSRMKKLGIQKTTHS